MALARTDPDSIYQEQTQEEEMPKTSEMKSSKFLKRDDVGVGALGTIVGVEQHNVAKEGAPEELKWCLVLAEFDKPLVLNSTNIQLIEAITGSDDTDGWKGKQVVLYDDPTVSFGGKITGGIRIRAPRNKQEQPLPF
jgi:hypothetical protein